METESLNDTDENLHPRCVVCSGPIIAAQQEEGFGRVFSSCFRGRLGSDVALSMS